MSNGDQRPQPPRNLLDRLTERLLMLVVPADLREPFEGDLLEESERFIAPQRGHWRTRLWLWGQIIRSLPALLVRRDVTEGAMDVKIWKWIAPLMVLVALLQAWDSQVFGASPLVAGIVLVAIALPVAAVLLTARLGVYGAAVALGFLLLLTARIASDTPLPELFLVLLPFGVLGLLSMWSRRKGTGRSGGAAA